MSVITDQFSSPIEALPNEMYYTVFRHFSPLELLTNRVVCKLWSELLINPQVMALEALNCRVIDEPEWRKHVPQLIERGYLSFEGTQPVDKRHFSTRLEVCKFLADQERQGLQVEKNMGVTLLTVPARLEIDHLCAEFGASIAYIWSKAVVRLGGIPVDKAFQVVISNNVFESILNDKNTRGKSVEVQRKIIGAAGCHLPQVLVAMTLALLTKKIDPSICIFDSETYTRCDDIELGLWVVGGFSSGLRVDGDDVDSQDCGAAGVRKFTPLALAHI